MADLYCTIYTVLDKKEAVIIKLSSCIAYALSYHCQGVWLSSNFLSINFITNCSFSVLKGGGFMCLRGEILVISIRPV